MKTQILIMGAVVGGVALYVLARRKPGESLATTAGREIVGAAVDAVGGAASAVGDVAASGVVGIGSVFGIPETNQDQCSLDLAAGRTWDASFSCPASRFIGNAFSSSSSNAADRADAEKVATFSAWDTFGNYTHPPQQGVTGTW